MDNPGNQTVPPVTPVPEPTPPTSTMPTTPVSVGQPADDNGQAVSQPPVAGQGTQPPSPQVGTPSTTPVHETANADSGNASVPLPQSVPQSFAPRKEAGAMGETKPNETVGQPNWAEADKVAKEENDEYWEKFSAEIEAEKKVQELGGLEKMEKGEAVISPELAAEMGVKPVAVLEPTADKNAFSVRGVSFSDDQIGAGMKAPTSTGVRWLVEWFVLQLLKAHFHIKKSWGGVVERSL